MTILIIISGSLIVFTFYLLITPIIISLKYNTSNKKNIAQIKFFPFKYRFILKKDKKKPGIKIFFGFKRLKKPAKKFPFWKFLTEEYETAASIIVDLFNFVRRACKSPDRYYLDVSLKGGLGPPDLTGQLFGAVESLKPMLGESLAIKYKPDYMSETIQGDIIADIKLRFYKLLKEMLIFIWKLPKLKLIKIIRLYRKGDLNVKQA